MRRSKRDHTTGGFLLTAFQRPDIFPYRSLTFLEVAHREHLILSNCSICTTSFLEKSSYESKSSIAD
jgi:hypothetical protein